MSIKSLKPVAAVSAAIAALTMTAPASAQVNGIATADAAVAVTGTQALQNGFQQIFSTYEAYRTEIAGFQQQRQTVLQGLDTNGDGAVDDAEAEAAPSQMQQVATLDQQIAQRQGPIQLAQIFVVSQVAEQYTNAVGQVISDRSIQIMLSPEALIYAPDEANVTQAVTEVLNARIPVASITPPDGWQPTQSSVNLYQQVQQILMIATAQAQQAAAANSGGQPAVEGR